MSAWTKFATKFFHEKQKQNPEYKFSQALKAASPLYKKMNKGGSSKKQRGGEEPVKMYKIDGSEIAVCEANETECLPLEEIEAKIADMEEGDVKNALIENYKLLAEPNANLLDMNSNVPDMDNIDNMNANMDNMNANVDNMDNMNANMDKMNANMDNTKTNNEDGTLLKGGKGGKKSQKKSKKAGKKSQKKQKKAKKAGSKKSKK